MKDQAKYQCYPFFIARTTLNSYSKYISQWESWGFIFKRDDLEKLFIEDKKFQESVLVSSKNLYLSILENNYKLTNKHFISLLKYFIRNSTRTTPYGLTAGVSTGRFSEETSINIGSDSSIKKIARPDMEWLYKVIKKSEEILGIKLRVRINNTLLNKGYKLVNVWNTYLKSPFDKNKEIVDQVSINNTKAVQIVFNSIQDDFMSIKDLLTILHEHYPDVNETVFHNFISELIGKEYLISDLRENLLNNHQFETLIDKLAKYQIRSDYFDKLESIEEKITYYNHLEIGKGIDTYVSLINQMEEIATSQNYLQVDMYRNPEQMDLDQNTKNDVEELADFLSIFATPREESSLQNYKNKFIDKYGRREVNLLEVIDEVYGIGLPNRTEENMIQRDQEDILEEYLNNRLIYCLENQQNEISISEEFVSNLRRRSIEEEAYANSNDKKSLPRSIELSLFILDNQKDQRRYICSPLIGSESAGQSIGRFMHLLNNKEEILHNLKQVEQTSNKETVEITFIPKIGRNANVMACETFRDTFLEFGSKTHLPEKKSISLEDIYIGLKGNHFYFRSKSTNNILSFSVNNKFNSNYYPPLFKFMIDASRDRQKNIFHVIQVIDRISRKFIKFPRVSYKNLILSPAVWRLESSFFKRGNQIVSKNEFTKLLAEYRLKYKIPDQVFVQEWDQRLLLDLNDQQCIELLYSFYRKNDKIKLLETIFKTNDQITKDSEGNRYLSEFVFLLQQKRPEKQIFNMDKAVEKISNVSEDSDQRVFFPFSRWMYLKMYIQPELENEVLISYIYQFANKLVALNLAKKFFFIRYKDNKQHIRLRFDLAMDIDFNHLLKETIRFSEELKRLKIMGAWSIDSYERELERYGGMQCIEQAEEFFYDDSLATIEILKAMEENNITMDEDTIVVISLAKLMHDAGISIEKQFEILDSVVKKDDYRDLFNKDRKNWIKMINSDHNWEELRSTDDGLRLFHILEKRSDSILRYWTQVEEEAMRGSITNSPKHILLSLIHMHFNRFFGVDKNKEKRGMALLRHSLHARLGYKKAQAKAFEKQ
ncbi:lantibiotic dehydratase [Thermoflavimicrobium daqui]|nr:lantibiotic dehydratase [Thermoflavimicrobium daqui]